MYIKQNKKSRDPLGLADEVFKPNHTGEYLGLQFWNSWIKWRPIKFFLNPWSSVIFPVNIQIKLANKILITIGSSLEWQPEDAY